MLDQDDLSKLVPVIRALDAKKLQRWCDVVRTPADNMLSLSLNTTTSAALLSSEALTVMTLPTYVANVAQSVSDNDSESDEEDEDYVSEHDLEVRGEQSGTEDSTYDTSGGTEATAKRSRSC
jgi:hypothetical protein